MVKTDDMMSIEDVTSILGINLLGVIPDSEKVIIASNRGEPIVLDLNNCLASIALNNTARRLNGEEVAFLNLEKQNSKNPLKRIVRNLINKPTN